MAEDKNDHSDFKVVDKRSFTADGARREGEEVATPKTDVPIPPSSTLEDARPSPPELEPEENFEAEGSGFEMLVSYLSTTAMFQLGLIPGPSGGRIPADLPNARRTIDLLEVLQQKTQGNLTADEARLLEDVLYDLRMTFVELEKRQARKSK
jgi:hypothetical protein